VFLRASKVSKLTVIVMEMQQKHNLCTFASCIGMESASEVIAGTALSFLKKLKIKVLAKVITKRNFVNIRLPN